MFVMFWNFSNSLSPGGLCNFQNFQKHKLNPLIVNCTWGRAVSYTQVFVFTFYYYYFLFLVLKVWLARNAFCAPQEIFSRRPIRCKRFYLHGKLIIAESSFTLLCCSVQYIWCRLLCLVNLYNENERKHYF